MYELITLFFVVLHFKFYFYIKAIIKHTTLFGILKVVIVAMILNLFITLTILVFIFGKEIDIIVKKFIKRILNLFSEVIMGILNGLILVTRDIL